MSCRAHGCLCFIDEDFEVRRDEELQGHIGMKAQRWHLNLRRLESRDAAQKHSLCTKGMVGREV